MIEARIEADSVSPAGSRITTFVLTYPRFIHSELMTHRVFSRNAASSRAIPFSRMVRMVRDNPAGPVQERHLHIPFGDKCDDLSYADRFKVATARCARVSYLTFDGEFSVESDMALHDRLRDAGHWSPFEHCATAMDRPDRWSGNYRGWVQYRKLFAQENVTRVDLRKLQREVPV